MLKIAWITQCIEQGKLLPTESFEVELNQDDVNRTHDGFRKRELFTLEDEKILIDHVHKNDINRFGTKVYEELARKYPQHSLESWRQHYKYMKKRLPPVSDSDESNYCQRIIVKPYSSQKDYTQSTHEQTLSSPISKSASVSKSENKALVNNKRYSDSYFYFSKMRRISIDVDYVDEDLNLINAYLSQFGKKRSLNELCALLSRRFSNRHTFSEWRALFMHFFPFINSEGVDPAILSDRETSAMLDETSDNEVADIDDQMIERKYLFSASEPNTVKSTNRLIFSERKAYAADDSIDNTPSKVPIVNSLSDPRTNRPFFYSNPDSMYRSISNPLHLVDSQHLSPLNRKTHFNNPIGQPQFTCLDDHEKTLRETSFRSLDDMSLRKSNSDNIFVKPGEDLEIPLLSDYSDSENISEKSSDDEEAFEKQVTSSYSSPIKVKSQGKSSKGSSGLDVREHEGSDDDAEVFVDRSPESFGATKVAHTSLEGNAASHKKVEENMQQPVTKKQKKYRMVNEEAHTGPTIIIPSDNNEKVTTLPAGHVPSEEKGKFINLAMHELQNEVSILRSSVNHREVDEAIDNILRYTNSTEQQFLEAMESTGGRVRIAIAKLLSKQTS
nr:hypothetical protein SPBC1778.02 - fission yeast (Schizosaccharomyces pombe) [Schizosaccharomyces pombe]